MRRTTNIFLSSFTDYGLVPCEHAFSSPQVVVRNETMAELGGEKLLWRLGEEFEQFPVTMGWFKKVDLKAPTNDPKARAPDLDLADHGIRLCIPSYASSGNVLEVGQTSLSWRVLPTRSFVSSPWCVLCIDVSGRLPWKGRRGRGVPRLVLFCCVM